jgi:hypothetical protein
MEEGLIPIINWLAPTLPDLRHVLIMGIVQLGLVLSLSLPPSLSPETVYMFLAALCRKYINLCCSNMAIQSSVFWNKMPYSMMKANVLENTSPPCTGSKVKVICTSRMLTDFPRLHSIVSQKIGKGKAIPVTGREGP